MEELLNKGHSRIIAQFHAIPGFVNTPLEPPSDMQQVFPTYSSVFDLPTCLPPTQG